MVKGAPPFLWIRIASIMCPSVVRPGGKLEGLRRDLMEILPMTNRWVFLDFRKKS